MRALEDTILALGRPIMVRTLGAPSAPTAAIARWKHSATIVDVSPSDTIRLAMSLVDRRNARSHNGGVPRQHHDGGSLSFFSPKEGVSIEVSGEADVVQLFINQRHAEATLDGPLDWPAVLDLRDDWMRTMMMKVLVRSARSGPDDALIVEEMLHGLILRVERHANQWRDRSKTSLTLFRSGLAPIAFRRVEEMIEAALLGKKSPTLVEMAVAARLSVSHFIRAFRAHTGSTPHHYIVRRRMDRAIALIRVEDASISDVAEQVGFSTPAHFVATFRTTIGVTPGALRDALT